MPRKIDPAKIKVGHGLAASDSVEVNAMIPSGAGSAPAGLTTHVQDDHNAHPAHAVSIDNVPEIYDSEHVEGALDELSALVPPRPSPIGQNFDYLSVNTVPDWGVLKLNDASISQRHPHLGLDWDNARQLDGREVYPYYWQGEFMVHRASIDALTEFPNNDPVDPFFNVYDAAYKGGGEGLAHAGSYSREGDVWELQSTAAVMPSSGPSGDLPVVLSGVVYPADRGTLALIRVAPGGELDEIVNGDDLFKRCIAAINLGQGILDKCDGDPGGIFTLGAPGGSAAPHSTDPYAYPGRATGQYDLVELHKGEDIYAEPPVFGPNDPLPSPFDDGDQDGNPGWNYAGQVRLGTDPNAGVPVVAGGMKILGGSTFARGGGHDSNFLAYRLPYMDSYDFDGGLRYTPASQRRRYMDKRTPCDFTDWNSYGGYSAFPKEYFTWQLARYRHQFTLTNDIILEGDVRESGSYMLIHFKKEEYFEELVRDGVWPTDDKIYSSNKAFENIEDYRNMIESTGHPDFGAYHVMKSKVIEDPTGGLPVGLSEFTLQYRHWNSPTRLNCYSGVAYYAPSKQSEVQPTESLRVYIDMLLEDNPADPNVTGPFRHTFLTSEYQEPLGDFAQQNWLRNDNPLFFSLGLLATEGEFKESGLHDMSWAGSPSNDKENHNEWIEVSYRDLAEDKTQIDPAHRGALRGHITFMGNVENPKFSAGGVVRGWFRRPLTHLSDSLNGVNPTPAEIESLVTQELYPTEIETKILYHGSKSENYGALAEYGNFMVAANMVQPGLKTDRKQSEERFLDEVYRYRPDFRLENGGPAMTQKSEDQLVGPGLPHGATAIRVPVWFGMGTLTTDTAVDWRRLAYLNSGSNLNSLATDETTSLQIAGLPDRNPSILEGRISPSPANGILLYPQHDYSTGYGPGTAYTVTIGLNPQPDYTGCSGDRVYIRAFDLKKGGASKAKLTFRGLQLSDIERDAGMVGNANLAILVKIPGLTTWMDIGRKDGSGPSKQDPFKDGAGCMIVGVDTVDHPADEEGIVSCDVLVHFGPAASSTEGFQGEFPMLMKIVYKDTQGSRALNFEQGGPDGPSENLRGLIQINVESR